MSEVGSAEFKAKANFQGLRRAALEVARALKRVEEARQDASGPLTIKANREDLERIPEQIERAVDEADPDPVEVGADTRSARTSVRRLVADVEDEQVDVPVDADTSAFRRGFERAVSAAEDEQVEVEVDADTSPFDRGLEAALRRWESRRAQVDIRTNVDQTGLKEGMRRIEVVTEGSRYTVEVDSKLSGAELAGEVRRQVMRAQAVATANPIEVPVEAEDSGVRRQVSLMARMAAVGQKVKIKVETDGSGVRKGFNDLLGVAQGFAGRMTALLSGLLTIPAMVAGINYAVAGLKALAAGAAAAAANLAPLVGLIATLPSLGAAVGGAFASVRLAFMGVTDALSAYKTSQKQAASAGTSAARDEQASAKARESAMRGVAKAQQALADAQKRAGDLQTAAVRRVAAAERGLQSAQRQSQKAQEALTRARKEAAEQLEDLRRQVNRNALSEERAVLGVEEARQRLSEVQSDPGASDLERRAALLDLKEAEADLLDVQDQRADDQATLNDLERKGVEGSDAVVDAKESVAQAEQGVLDAQQELAASQAGIVEAQLEGARLIADAQAGLEDALRAVSDAAVQMGAEGAAAVDPFAEALAELPPSAQAFVKQLVGMEPLLDRLRTIAADNLFPGLTIGLNNIVTMMPIAERLVARFSSAVGDAAKEISGLALEPQFRADLEDIGNTGVGVLRRLAGAAKPVARSLVGVSAAAGGLTQRVVDFVSRYAEMAAAWVDMQRQNGNLQKFFQLTGDIFERVMRSVGHALRGIVEIGRIAFGVFGDMTGGLEDGAKAFSEWTRSADGVAKIKKFFEDARAPLREMWLLLKDVVALFFDLGDADDLTSLIRQIRTEFLPVIKEFLTATSGEFGEGLLRFVTSLADVLGSLSSAGGPLIMFLEVMTRLLDALDWIAENVPGASSAFTTLAIAAGTLSAIRFTSFITGLSGIMKFMGAKNADGVSRFARAMDKMGPAVKGATGAISKGFSLAGEALAGFGRMLLTNPVILIITAIIAAIALLAYIVYRNWDTIKGWWQDGVMALGLLWAQYGQPVVEAIITAWNWLKDKTIEIWNTVWDFLKQWWPALVGALTGPIGLIVGLIVANWETIKTKTIEAWNAVKEWIAAKLLEIWLWISDRLTAIRALWDSVWEWIRVRAIVAWEAIKAAVLGGIEAIRSWIANRLESIRSIWDRIWGGLAGGFQRVWDTVTGAARNGANALIDILNGMIRGVNIVLARLPGGFQIPTISYRFAEGGSIPDGSGVGFVGGTGRGDHVPALLEPREFVTRRAIVEQEGVRSFEMLNAGRATIVPLDDYRKRRYSNGGVAGKTSKVQRFAKGGLVEDVTGWFQDRAADLISPAIRAAWGGSRAVAGRAIEGIPGQNNVVGNFGAGVGRKILAEMDALVERLLRQLEAQERAQAAAVAAMKRQAAAQVAAAAQTTGTTVSRGVAAIGRSAVPTSVPGTPLMTILAKQFPTATLKRLSDTVVSIVGGPTQEIARFITTYQKDLRVSKVYGTGYQSLRADVYHDGGGVGWDPSKEMMALLQKGEGVMSVQAVKQAELALSGPTVGAVRATSPAQTIVNIEVINPSPMAAEESLHREMQKLATHGILPPVEDVA